MKRAILIGLTTVLLPVISDAAIQISDNFTFGSGGYWGNSTSADVELPGGFGLRGSFSLSSSGGSKFLAYSMGMAKEFFFQIMSLSVTYCGNQSEGYISNEGDFAFSYSPLPTLSTLFNFQVEGEYSFTIHTVTVPKRSALSHSLRVGGDLSILQTTNITVAYTTYFYPPIDLNQLQRYIRFKPELAGVLGLVFGFPASTLDVSVSHFFWDMLCPYFSYSFIKQIDNSISHSFLLGADYYILPSWSAGLAYNLFSSSSLSHYCSLGTTITF